MALTTKPDSFAITTLSATYLVARMPPAPFRMCEGNDYSLVPPMGFYWVKDGHYPGYKHDNLVMLSELAERVAAIKGKGKGFFR